MSRQERRRVDGGARGKGRVPAAWASEHIETRQAPACPLPAGKAPTQGKTRVTAAQSTGHKRDADGLLSGGRNRTRPAARYHPSPNINRAIIMKRWEEKRSRLSAEEPCKASLLAGSTRSRHSAVTAQLLAERARAPCASLSLEQRASRRLTCTFRKRAGRHVPGLAADLERHVHPAREALPE